MWRALWALAVLFPLALELVAILSPGEGDMLSAIVIPLLHAHPLAWGAALTAYAAFVTWLGWHWWFQYRGRKRGS